MAKKSFFADFNINTLLLVGGAGLGIYLLTRSDSGSSAIEQTGGLIGATGGAVSDVFTGFGAGTLGVGSGVGVATEGLGAGIENALTGLANAFTGLGNTAIGIGSGVEGIGAGVQNVGEGIEAVGGGLNKTFLGLGGGIDLIGSGINKTLSPFTTVSGQVTGFLPNTINAGSGFLDSLANLFGRGKGVTGNVITSANASQYGTAVSSRPSSSSTRASNITSTIDLSPQLSLPNGSGGSSRSGSGSSGSSSSPQSRAPQTITIARNEFGTFSPVVNGRQLPMSVAPGFNNNQSTRRFF